MIIMIIINIGQRRRSLDTRSIVLPLEVSVVSGRYCAKLVQTAGRRRCVSIGHSRQV